MSTEDQLHQEKEFQNEQLHVKMAWNPGCQVKLAIQVSPKATQAARQRAYRSLKKEISVPGFRKGKAPDHLIQQKFSDQIEQEWHDILVRTALFDAFKLTNVWPYHKDSIQKTSLKQVSEVEGSLILSEYEAAPPIPTDINLNDVELKRPVPPPISEEEVQRILNYLRTERTSLVPIEEDRPVQQGDFITVDLYSIDDQDEEKLLAENVEYTVEPEAVESKLYDVFLGMQIGESRETDYESLGRSRENSAERENPDNTPKALRLHLKSIQKRQQPEVDDAFARSYGADSVEDLVNKVRHNLEHERQLEVRGYLLDQLQFFLEETFQFDLPLSMTHELVEYETKRQLQQLRLNTSLSQEEYDERAAKLRHEVYRLINGYMRMHLLVENIAKNKNISVPEHQLQQTLFQQKLRQSDLHLTPPLQFSEEEIIQTYRHLLKEKVLEHLLSTVKIVDLEPEEQKEEDQKA